MTNASHGLNGILKQGLIALFLLAFLCKAFVPAGFMPGTSAGSPVVICSDMGMKIIHVDENGQPVDQKQTLSEPCSFAANGIGVAPDKVMVQTHHSVFAVAFVLQEKAFLLTAPRYAAHSPRGPPVLS